MLFSTIILDFLLHGWKGIFVDLFFLMFTSFVILLIFTNLGAKVCVYFQRKKYTFSGFLTRRQMEQKRWYNHPVFTTICVAYGSVLLLIYGHWIHHPSGFDFWLFIDNSQALAAVPLVTAFVFILMRLTSQKMKEYIDKLVLEL